ncbi:MAG: hypothetical protein ACJ73S_19405 [Mycobacteriales bacterium]
MRWQTHDQPDDVWHLIHELAEVQTPEEFTEVVNALFEYARLEETGAVIKIPSGDNTSP